MFDIKLDPTPVSVVMTSVNYLIKNTIETVLKKHNLGAMITSGCDNIHSSESAHYYNMALDFRISWPITLEDAILRALDAALLPGYRYRRETNHLHVERFSGPYPWVKP